MNKFLNNKKMYYSSIDNSVCLQKINFIDMIAWSNKYNKIDMSKGGYIFRNNIWCNCFLEKGQSEELIINSLIHEEITKKYSFNYVYLIAGTHKGETKYKIGKANVLQERLSKFNVKIPFDIDLMFSFCVKDALSLEGKLHKTLKNKRLSGEWFDLDKKDILKIVEIGMQKEIDDYYDHMEKHIKQREKEKWLSDKDYINYLESVLVFNNVSFEARI